MTFYFIGLGNPGEEYALSRHSVGRMFLDEVVGRPPEGLVFSDWVLDKKLQALKSEGKVGKHKVVLLKPETFMNRSGLTVKALSLTGSKIKTLAVIHDDVDLPLGSFKLNFNRGPGGHRGLDSIMKALHSQEFVRFRFGVSTKTPGGKIKKPTSDKVADFIVADFKKPELEELQKIIKNKKAAISVLVSEGLAKAMNKFN